MSAHSLFAVVIVMVFLDHTAFGQSQKAKEPFPSYDQIRQKERDITDYVNTDGSARVVEKAIINLFDYPRGTVTYILNGKPSDNVAYVKRVLSGKGKYIENVSISKPGQTGKLVIDIKYGRLNQE
jgi:hypothetical protein